MTLDDLQAKAWQAMTAPAPKINKPNPDAAIYKYWLAHKEVGPPLTNEQTLEDGTTALLTATGRILHWLGGDQVEVV